MAGLGELLGKLFGGQRAGGAETERASILARVAAAVGNALARIPGTPTEAADTAMRAKSLLENREAVLDALARGDAEAALRASGVLSQAGTDATIESVETLAGVLAGRTAQQQLEAIIGVEIPDSATTTKAVMDQLAVLTQANEAIQALSIAAEVASVGQIDRVGDELRSYLNYSGISQISGFGYGQILGTVVGTRMNQELLAVTRPAIPSVADLCSLRTLGLIDEAAFMDGMARLGYPDDVAESLYTASLYYPGPGDWIRFAVRDVFNPEVVESAGLDDQFPEDILEPAARAGVSEEMMRMHWRAHWNLPSVNQAFEMLHRGFISIDELRNLLKAADYAPGYIDALIGIAYRPYTRVDARRMYDLGILDDDGYLQAMRDIGYDDEHAANMLLFAKSESGAREKDLSQAQMMKAYALGKVARADLHEFLKTTGYDDEEADLLIELEDAKKAEDILKEQISVLDWRYERGDIGDGDYLDALASQGIPREKAQYYLSRAALSAEKKVKLPSKSDVEKWYRAGYIGETRAITYLRQMGYRLDEIMLYLQTWQAAASSGGGESNA